jgi:hypothetical protein
LTPSEATQRDLGVTSETAMVGILALLVDEREERIKETEGVRKTEILLAEAGLPSPVIASLMGKKPDAVRKTLQRGRG